MFFLQFVSIYILLLSSADDNRSIYIYRDEKRKSHIKMPCKGKIPWEKGFLWGTINSENGAWQSFGGSQVS